MGTKFIINGNLGFYQSLLVWSHDNQPPYLIMILVGGNNRDYPWSFNYTIIHKETSVSIEGGSYKKPLILYANGNFGRLSITPLGFHYRRLSVEVIN